MFEKEAEKHSNEVLCSVCENVTCAFEGIKCREWRDRRAGFYCGAEFGYNKAKEWHFVKDGDFPTDRTEKKYLVALKSEYGGFFYETDIWCESLHCFASNNPKNVYAWQEITTPKESE